MAGGGLKRGVVHGSTDELGFHAVEHRHYVTDIHATILKQLGLNSRKLEIPGRSDWRSIMAHRSMKSLRKSTVSSIRGSQKRLDAQGSKRGGLAGFWNVVCGSSG